MNHALVPVECAGPYDLQASEQWTAKSQSLVGRMRRVECGVVDQVTYEEAASLQRDISHHLKAMEQHRKKLTQPLLDGQRRIKAVADQASKPLAAALAELKQAMGAYAELQRKREEEERRRLEEEQRASIEQQLAERQAAEELGLADPQDAFTPEVPTAAPMVMPATSGDVSIVERLVFAITDPDKVERRFLEISEKKINAWIREYRGSLKKRVKAGEGASVLPGLELSIKTETRSRG